MHVVLESPNETLEGNKRNTGEPGTAQRRDCSVHCSQRIVQTYFVQQIALIHDCFVILTYGSINGANCASWVPNQRESSDIFLFFVCSSVLRSLSLPPANI